MSYEVFSWIFNATLGSGFIPLIVYALKVKRVSLEIHILAGVILASLLADSIGHALALYLHSNVLSNNTYLFFEFSLMSWFYYEILFRKHYRTAFAVSIVLYIIVYSIITIFVQGFFEQQTFAWSAVRFIILIYALLYVHHVVLTGTITSLSRYSLMWINGAILFHFGFSSALFSMYVETFTMDADSSWLIYGIFNMSHIITNILFAIGIYYAVPKKIQADLSTR